MGIDSSKYYLRPFGLVEKNIGKNLFKRKKAISVNSRFFCCIELIVRKKKIIKKVFTVNEFFEFVKVENNSKINKLLNHLTNQKKKFLNNNSFFSKNQNHAIFGILNITPDSFSDGGENQKLNIALEKAIKMTKDGADFIDIGGESTRPGAKKVDPVLECLRILPVVQVLDEKNLNLSLDTRNSQTMKLGILNGINLINDVSALTNDKKSIEVLKKYKLPLIIMHMPGTPKTMMKKNNYKNVVLDVYDFLEERIKFCESNGLSKENIIIDPGIGFGKDHQQNLELLQNLSIFHTLGCSVMLGVSRKRFISEFSNSVNPKERLGGTISATLSAAKQGIEIHRVHDVKEVRQALNIFEKVNSI